MRKMILVVCYVLLQLLSASQNFPNADFVCVLLTSKKLHILVSTPLLSVYITSH